MVTRLFSLHMHAFFCDADKFLEEMLPHWFLKRNILRFSKHLKMIGDVPDEVDYLVLLTLVLADEIDAVDDLNELMPVLHKKY